MAAFALNPGLDRKEAAAIERRRMLEEERKRRIFNPKSRTIGVDKQALDYQVQLKQQRKQAEEARERAYAAEQERTRQTLLAMERQQEEERRQMRIEQERFRQAYQRYDTRREFDLNDPDRLLKDQPARTRDFDRSLGPSSLQVFTGEDLEAGNRRKQQQQQQRRWIAQQLALKEQQRREEEEAQRLAELRDKELLQRATEMEEAQQQTQKQVDAATRRYNAQLAAERRARERAEAMQTLQENLEEQRNMLYSDQLNENPAVARNSNNGRLVTTEFRGMLPEERQAIRDEQARQAEAAARRRAQQEEEQRRWELQQEANRRQALRLAAQEERARREMDRQVMVANAQLANEAYERRMHLDQQVYTNQPTQAYWDQWNTTTR